MDNIRKNSRINSFQRSFLLFFCKRKDLIRNPTDGNVKNFDIIKFAYIVSDIPCGHCLGIHVNDLLFHVLSNHILIFLDDLWFEPTFMVSWDINTAIAGIHSLLGITASLFR